MLWIVAAALAATPTYPELAEARGWAAVREAIAADVAETPAKKLEKTLAARGLGALEVPVSGRAGAELSLTFAPAGGCRWAGTLTCDLRAEGPGAPSDYRVLCRGPLGTTRPMTATPGEALSWAVSGVEACWDFGGDGLLVVPVAAGSLEGVGEGTDALPPERVALTWEQVEAEITRGLPSFRMCSREVPGARGEVEVAFRIAADGAVASAEVSRSTGDEALQACVLARFRKLHFPPTMGGVSSGTYPFNYQE